MSTFVNHYDVLGVLPTASKSEIATAFWAAYDDFDAGNRNLDAHELQAMHSSYKVLSDPEERARFNGQLRRLKKNETIKALREENNLISGEKVKLEKRAKDHLRKSEQKEQEVRVLDAELRRQEKVNEKLRQSLENFHLGSPKLKRTSDTTSGVVCRFCGKETMRPRHHLSALSTDMLCVERKILYLLQASDNLSDPDSQMLDGICTKLANTSEEKIRQLEAKVPTLIAFQAKFAEEILEAI